MKSPFFLKYHVVFIDLQNVKDSKSQENRPGEGRDEISNLRSQIPNLIFQISDLNGTEILLTCFGFLLSGEMSRFGHERIGFLVYVYVVVVQGGWDD
jgi:hypothetical protein